MLGWVKNKIKYWFALIWYEKLLNEVNWRIENHIGIDEAFNQKWIHIQGLCLTKGRMKLNWRKLFPKEYKR